MCVNCGINSCGCSGKNTLDTLGPPPATEVITGHNIVIGDISTNGGSDITIDSVLTSYFNYKSLGNGMVWFSLTLRLNTTVGSGASQSALNRRINNLPVRFSESSLTMFQGDVYRGGGPLIWHLIVAEGLTVPGVSSIDILNFTEDIPTGTWNGMELRMSGIAPGTIL